MDEHAIYWLRALGAIITGGLFVFIAAMNAALAVSYLLRRTRGSCVPVIGGLFGVIALLLAPWPGFARFALVAVIVDIGCAPAVVGALVRAFVLSRVRK